MRDKANILIKKYNQGTLNQEEEQLLEQYIEQGWIQLEELKDIQALDEELSHFFGNRLSYQMRRNFQQMMAKEKQSTNGIWQQIRQLWNRPPRLNLAYVLLFVLSGWAVGWMLNKERNPQTSEIAVLSNELQQMRETMMLSMLEKESTSDRLKAVSLTQKMEGVNENVATALLQTLNRDENTNVRLAALDALVPYANNPTVREGLIKSIAAQESPLVQLALAEVMVSLQEKRSVQPLKELLEQRQMPEEIKEKIQNSIEVLL